MVAPRVKARRRPRVAGPSTHGLRMCLGCREKFERGALVRVVCDPTGELLVDRNLRAPGRGAHLCYNAACLGEAVRRRAFGRALDAEVRTPSADALIAAVVVAIEARIEESLRIGRRAGWIRSGTEAIEREMPRLHLLVLAEDTAQNTALRWRRRAEAAEVPVYEFRERVALGRTQGMEERTVLGVTDAARAASLKNEFERRDRVLVAAAIESR